ncbi:hypothetical protein ACOZ4I_15220 [Haloarcula salina]|uniref:hypothetical protein n=1 Tax=Haloarcula salina TaxID=1429914 RepID=UPI003C6F83C3
MANSSPSRSDRKADEADVSYDIATPFSTLDAGIYLFEKEDSVEVLIGHIPEPYMYYDNYNTDNREQLDQHAIARWIVDDVASELSDWEHETSFYSTRNPNYHLRDIYFECDQSEVNEAVLSARRFLITLEEKVVKQKQRIDRELGNSPLQDLSE